MENEVIKKELETLSLGFFDWVTPNNAAVQLSQFIDEDNEYYSVTLLLWLKSSTNTGDVPITLETQVGNSCMYCAAYEGIQLALSIVGSVYTDIIVFDEDADIIEELNAQEVIDAFKDEEGKDE